MLIKLPIYWSIKSNYDIILTHISHKINGYYSISVFKDQDFFWRFDTLSERKYKTKADILERAHQIIGVPLKEIDKTGRLSIGKGAIGSIIEESLFGYKINSESTPDFEEVGVEVKTTPYIKTNKGIRAKERLVCNIINYMGEYQCTFETSSFWKKCRTMLLLSYEHKDDVPKGDFMISDVVMFSFPNRDLEIIKNDWNRIVDKIREGRAHELSEGDTTYLGACTKGENSLTMRTQPYSDIPAKQRAFAIKQSYMTYIFNNYIFGNSTDEHIIKNPEDLRSKSFEQYIVEIINPFIGKTQNSLCERFSLKSSAKNLNELLLARILGVEGRISDTEEFKKANIVPKTIRLNEDGSITESMSFPAFKFKKLVTEDWEHSEFKEYLEQTKFLFVIFRFRGDSQLVFDDLFFWHIPDPDLEEVGNVWKRTVEILKRSVKLQTSGKRTFNDFPKSSESRVAHVRPHARDKNDTDELPDGRMMPKQCFWLNNTYIREQIECNKQIKGSDNTK